MPINENTEYIFSTNTEKLKKENIYVKIKNATNFIKDIGFNMVDFERDGFLFPVYEMDIKFISPTRYDEKIYVETSIHKLSRVKMVYEQRILNDKNEEKTRAFVTIVCVTKDDFKITRFDRELKEFYDRCLKFLEI